jgi:hypothetical protein
MAVRGSGCAQTLVTATTVPGGMCAQACQHRVHGRWERVGGLDRIRLVVAEHALDANDRQSADHAHGNARGT